MPTRLARLVRGVGSMADSVRTSVRGVHTQDALPRFSAVRPANLRDTISVRALEVRITAGLDGWGRAIPQPVRIDAVLRTDVEKAGHSDHLPYSLNYGEVYRALERHCREHAYKDVGQLAHALAGVCVQECRAPWAEVSVRLPRALLQARYATMHVARDARDFPQVDPAHAACDRLEIEALEVFAILGVNPWERESKQRLLIHLGIAHGLGAEEQPQYEAMVRAVTAFVEASSYQTVESLATHIARVIIVEHGAAQVAVRVEKPSAIVYAECASVEVVRDRAFFGVPAPVPAAASDWHSAALALGSNLGDRLGYIEAALQLLDAHDDVRVVDTSFLYETQPMYYSDQPNFLNGACRVRFAADPDPHAPRAARPPRAHAVDRDAGRAHQGECPAQRAARRGPRHALVRQCRGRRRRAPCRAASPHRRARLCPAAAL